MNELKVVKGKEQTNEREGDAELLSPSLDLSYLGEWEPKRLDIVRSIRFTRWTTRVGVGVMSNIQGGDVAAVLAALYTQFENEDSVKETEDAIAELYSIILDRPKSWVRSNWDLNKALDAFAGFLAVEQMGKTIASVRSLLDVLIPNRMPTRPDDKKPSAE